MIKLFMQVAVSLLAFILLGNLVAFMMPFLTNSFVIYPIVIFIGIVLYQVLVRGSNE
jgi:hypothetical protein